MGNKKNNVINLISLFQKKIMEKKPTPEKMLQEVRMMKFKIKPLDGDISNINFLNLKFIETLWSLGKLDDFFRNEYKKLAKEDQKIFYNFFDDIYRKYQSDLNSLKLKSDQLHENTSMVEIEIFKDKLLTN